MTTQTVIICDRCKEEILKGNEKPMTLASKAEIDFCSSCYDEFCAFLKGATVLAKEVPPEPEENAWDLDEECPVHGNIKRGRLVVSAEHVPDPGCTCDLLYPDTCRECLGEKGRHKMDCSEMRKSQSALESITSDQWRAIQDKYEPIVNEVNEARRMLKRLRGIEARADAVSGVTRGMISTAQLRHAISGDLEVADGDPA